MSAWNDALLKDMMAGSTRALAPRGAVVVVVAAVVLVVVVVVHCC